MTAHFKKIRTWRERIGQAAEYPLHLATDVERAMEEEIAELRAAVRGALLGLIAMQLQKACAAADVERDAVRYRWLREHGFGMPRLGAALDSSIDAAIAVTRPGKPA